MVLEDYDGENAECEEEEDSGHDNAIEYPDEDDSGDSEG